MQPYSYTVVKPDYYTFVTDEGNVYECYFYEFSAVFADYPRLAANVFGFNLELKETANTSPKGIDKKLPVTVAAILREFLTRKKDVVVYVCDSSDNREKARFHKFNHWFRLYNDGNVIQLRGVIRAGDSTVLNAMLIHKDNPQINDFIEAYEVMTGAYTKPDDDELRNILNDDGW